MFVRYHDFGGARALSSADRAGFSVLSSYDTSEMAQQLVMTSTALLHPATLRDPFDAIVSPDTAAPAAAPNPARYLRSAARDALPIAVLRSGTCGPSPATPPQHLPLLPTACSAVTAYPRRAGSPPPRATLAACLPCTA